MALMCFRCKTCDRLVDEEGNHLHPFVCNSCHTQKRADHLQKLRDLPNCERLSKIEAWMYDRQEQLDYELKMKGWW